MSFLRNVFDIVFIYILQIAELKEDISVLKQERIHSESELKFEKEEKLRGVESINSLQLQLEQVGFDIPLQDIC